MSSSNAVTHNIAEKYGTEGEIRLSGSANWDGTPIESIKLADGRTLVGGTVTLDTDGEPTITGHQYLPEQEQAEPIPLRVAGE